MPSKTYCGKYDGTPLWDRWEETTCFGAGQEATDYWIRDSDGLVNVVWINGDGIRDIALFSPSGDTASPGGESMFNFVPFTSVVALDVREGPNMAIQMGLPVSGDILTQVITQSSPNGTLWWVANSQEEVVLLRNFLKAVCSAFLLASQS